MPALSTKVSFDNGTDGFVAAGKAGVQLNENGYQGIFTYFIVSASLNWSGLIQVPIIPKTLSYVSLILTISEMLTRRME